MAPRNDPARRSATQVPRGKKKRGSIRERLMSKFRAKKAKKIKYVIYETDMRLHREKKDTNSSSKVPKEEISSANPPTPGNSEAQQSPEFLLSEDILEEIFQENSIVPDDVLEDANLFDMANPEMDALIRE